MHGIINLMLLRNATTSDICPPRLWIHVQIYRKADLYCPPPSLSIHSFTHTHMGPTGQPTLQAISLSLYIVMLHWASGQAAARVQQHCRWASDRVGRVPLANRPRRASNTMESGRSSCQPKMAGGLWRWHRLPEVPHHALHGR